MSHSRNIASGVLMGGSVFAIGSEGSDAGSDTPFGETGQQSINHLLHSISCVVIATALFSQMVASSSAAQAPQSCIQLVQTDGHLESKQ
jgi:hypothetical protein